MGVAWIILLVASLAVAIVAVLAFKKFSNPASIRGARNRLLARFVELFLYQESLGSLGRAGGRLGMALGRYLLALFLPLFAAAVIAIPILLAVAPLISLKPISTGMAFLVEAGNLSESHTVSWNGDGVDAAAPPVRIPGEYRIIWKCRASEASDHRLLFQSGGEEVTFPISVGENWSWIVSRWTADPLERLLPGVGGLDPERAGFGTLAIDYPPREFDLGGASFDWLTLVSSLSFVFSIPIAVIARITV